LVRRFSWTLLVILATGCGPVATSTPIPSADSPAPLPTDWPPTATPTAALTAEPSPTAAPVTEAGVPSSTWMKTYSGSLNSVCGDVQLTEDGGYFIVGTTALQFEPEELGDVYLIRTDASGKVLWEQTYGGEKQEWGQTISTTDDDGLLISAVTASFGAGGTDAYLIKADREGNELGTLTFGGPLDEMVSAWPMPDGGYLVGGNLVDPNDIVADAGAAGYGGFAGRSNIYIAKIDSDGDELWSRTYGDERNVMATSGVQTSDGGFLILATIMYFPDGDDDILLLRVDENGDEVWSLTWEEGTLSSNDLIETSDGNYLVSGSYSPADDPRNAQADFLFIKVDPDGNELWTSIFGDPDLVDYGYAVTEAPDGGYVAAGEQTRDLYTWDADIVLVKIDGEGQLVWKQTIETGTHTMIAAIQQHPDGGYIICGSPFGGRSFDILLIKTDDQGRVTE
jgi:hypothetical protein